MRQWGVLPEANVYPGAGVCSEKTRMARFTAALVSGAAVMRLLCIQSNQSGTDLENRT